MEGRNLSAALEIATATHPGMVRSHNEDSIMADADIGLAVLADGMGGYNAGEVASGIAVALIPAEMRKAFAARAPEELNGGDMERLIREQAARANTTIYQTAQKEPQYRGMGTTLVVALWHDNHVAVGHIGDSRAYRLRDDKLEQITRDHSLLQEQIDRGMLTREDARHAPNRNLVTRAVGIDPGVESEIHVHAVQPEDVYLLCSDGLPDMVPDEDIENTLALLKSNLQLAAEQLVQQANDHGGRDNVSVILVRVLKPFPARPGWLGKLKSMF